MSKVGDVQIELVQPLEGNSIFKEFLEKRGEGIHHLKYTVSDPEQVLERLRKEGIEILQSGKLGQGAFYYLDTESRLGFILELATGQALKLRPPDEIYPPDQAHLVSP
jgi:4-hydroxyphenylpyruvate dioxygenase-like putative hemolysin